MSALTGRRVVLGVGGGIAAYKAVDLCRRLVDAGAHVSVVMTDGATRFVGEVTFSALASEPVHRSLFDDGDPIPHTRLGQGADLVIVAPATARILSAYSTGYSHDLLTNVLIATRAPVLVCPAMHTEMWEHPSVQDNMATLVGRGVHVVAPEEGRLAGGDVGAGRLAEPATIMAAAEQLLGENASLRGRRVLVTAGGTREPIDPVRFIGNRSSGKQGHAVAEEAARRGAEVVLVTTSALPTPAGCTRVDVSTAAELHDAVTANRDGVDAVVMTAAVADFTPVTTATDKIKKGDGVPTIELRPTSDVLAELGSTRRPGEVIVGFAAETADVVDNARRKLVGKGADLIVVNDVAAAGAGFEGDTNEVVILSAHGADRHVPLAGKAHVAAALLDSIEDLLAPLPGSSLIPESEAPPGAPPS